MEKATSDLRQIAVNQRRECLIESFERSVKGVAGDVIGSIKKGGIYDTADRAPG